MLLDRPDSNRDHMLSEHVMYNHLTSKQKRQRVEMGVGSQKKWYFASLNGAICR